MSRTALHGRFRSHETQGARLLTAMGGYSRGTTVTADEELPPGLTYGGDEEPGIRRHGHKRPRYVDDRTGEVVRDREVLARIRSIVIPPAWTDVWISADPRTHIQATGRDARGRKQYRYHSRFRAHREEAKFDELVPFGEQLGSLRHRLETDLALPGLPRERVTAVVVRLLEQTLIRVGNEEYARSNRTYGLTTLRDRHVQFGRGELRIRYQAKGAKVHEVACDDPRLCRLVRRCQDLPGQKLFQWLDSDGERHALTSSDVNDYLRAVTGLEATSKTFRTWGATVLATSALATVDGTRFSDRQRQKLTNRAVELVADVLGNTPAVCRRSYIHPVVVDRFLDGRLARRWDTGPARPAGGLLTEERRLLHVLRARP